MSDLPDKYLWGSGLNAAAAAKYCAPTDAMVRKPTVRYRLSMVDAMVRKLAVGYRLSMVGAMVRIAVAACRRRYGLSVAIEIGRGNSIFRRRAR